MSQPRKDPDWVTELFELDAPGARLWRSSELRDVFEHQLRAQLSLDLPRVGIGDAKIVEALAGTCGAPPLRTFDDLLKHPAPSLELLRLVKEFAKVAQREPDVLLPGEVATALYFASIAAARVRHGVSLTRLADQDLADGWRWVADQPWIDVATRTLATQALKKS